MDNNGLKSYKRRKVTRESGYHTCDNTNGSECLIIRSKRIEVQKEISCLTLCGYNIELVELFEKSNGIVAFGGFIKSDKDISISLTIYADNKTIIKQKIPKKINKNEWNSIGIHQEVNIEEYRIIKKLTVDIVIEANDLTSVDFFGLNAGAINKKEFLNNTLEKSFYQKTKMHIPYLYYLDHNRELKYFIDNIKSGELVVLKSCNRCGRYLPINYKNEIQTLAFSLHCRKNAPCKHSSFSNYTIENIEELNENDKKELKIEDGKLISYYGHQLECKSCKKFFVNRPLNPQRTTQQFREDSLRRRAIEVLVNNLLRTNLYHFEFEKKTKKQFSEYIWNKFDRKCFKCGKKIELKEMNLDHTMPLAYLYRLDETATCLCGLHNSQKSDHFPVDYYSKKELEKLSKITGLKMDILESRTINIEILKLLVKNIVWFYEVFLNRDEYQKIREGIKTSDKINDSLRRVIGGKVDLIEEYYKVKNKYPDTITVLKG